MDGEGPRMNQNQTQTRRWQEAETYNMPFGLNCDSNSETSMTRLKWLPGGP